MFCPLAIDYGSLADWVAGVGTLLAVIAALWIAGSQQRAETASRIQLSIDAKARTKRIVREASEIAAQISQRSQQILSRREAIDTEDSQIKAATDEKFIWLHATVIQYLHEMSGFREQLIALCRFPIDDVSAFVIINRMAHEADIGYMRNIDHRRVPKFELQRVVHDMEQRRNELSNFIEHA